MPNDHTSDCVEKTRSRIDSMAIHLTGNGPYSCSMICKQHKKKERKKEWTIKKLAIINPSIKRERERDQNTTKKGRNIMKIKEHCSTNCFCFWQFMFIHLWIENINCLLLCLPLLFFYSCPSDKLLWPGRNRRFWRCCFRLVECCVLPSLHAISMTTEETQRSSLELDDTIIPFGGFALSSRSN